jgi:hypothetical protein
MKDCKPGGCSSIGCEGGFYCFNEDGTPKVVSDETKIWLQEALDKYDQGSADTQIIHERLKSIDQAVKVNIEDL